MADIRKRTGAKGTTYQVRYPSNTTKSGYTYATFNTLKEARAFLESGSLRKKGHARSGDVGTVAEATDMWLRICRKEGLNDREPVTKYTYANYEYRAGFIKAYDWPKTLAGRVQGASFPSEKRTVISISERMPEIGRTFYETGPAKGVATVHRYLESEVAAGNLVIEDCEVAAAEFLDSCCATILKPLPFNAGDAPTDERTDHVVGIAVRTFLAAYRRVV
ncbi:MAG: hypothetical protein DLM68_10355 [Hyphomicrobiales bacterium]|nr:MAG: hypothetical protein DLM68_10355 [Hyphomicrobiales bacterium]